MSTTVLVVYGAIVAFAHSNTRLGFGPLERIFVSPNYHRIHHQLDGPQDVNLGFALTIWDQLFRRAVFPTADDDPGRHRAPGSAARRRTGGADGASSRRSSPRSWSPRSVRCASRTDLPPVRSDRVARRAHDRPRDATSSEPARAPHRSRAPRDPAVGRCSALFSTRTRAPGRLSRSSSARTVLAWIFIYHGSRRLFGWFDGPGHPRVRRSTSRTPRTSTRASSSPSWAASSSSAGASPSPSASCRASPARGSSST